MAQGVEKGVSHPVAQAREATKWSPFGVSRQSLEKLFGKSEWVPNRPSEGRQERTKEARSAASCRQKRTVETPSAIFQTVSEQEFSEVRLDGILRGWVNRVRTVRGTSLGSILYARVITHWER